MRIFPEMNPWMTWPFSSFTLKVALGRFSITSPCISITSSLAMSAVVLALARGHPALEVRLAQQALVLVRHDIGLHLRHEIHGDDHDDEQRGAAEIKRHAPLEDQELGQQAHERHVHRP